MQSPIKVNKRSDDEVKDLFVYLKETVIHMNLSDNHQKTNQQIKQSKLKIAALDLVLSPHFLISLQDSTLIQTISQEQFAKNENDWKYMFKNVPSKLRKLHQDGFKLVIFTQQMGIQKGILTPINFAKKALNIQKDVRHFIFYSEISWIYLWNSLSALILISIVNLL
ncbi:bifunctional polynucleotide phosphatase kinase-like [Stylonychia lemnae]|uniref:Bifunctional polynucleotide phosphatase kinase-like n=1 Tax=Stylonychia lemnae TaxID=5949 RepID=A0A078B2A2_STYLE|nr:bifunctional polynucleotide phosphatase kinase-like [Stylonychia lemnae]|eukprot:CDW87593.1 bifunctional polynucleotide phosphatase kinase-like [Stylonychia lemnae]